MKKTLLAVTLLSALSLSSAANAFTEATDGTFSGDLNFSGTITDDNPIWAWEIPAVPGDVTGWDALVLNGVVSGENTTFTFASKAAMTLIHGYMKTPSISGGAGITPVITVGNDGSTVVLSGDHTQDVTIVATGKNAANEAVANGTMAIKAQAFLGGVLKTTFEGNPINKLFGSTKAQNVVKLQADFDTTYPTPLEGVNNFADTEALFANQAMIDLSGAYVAEISDYRLTFPSASLPATWSAIIPVTVTLK